MIYLKLFFSFIQIGLFSIGGGHAAIPLIQSQVVEINHWLSLSEFIDLITIAEMTPGPIAINAATFVGIQIAGGLGAIVATLGCILPSCFIVSLLAFVYYKYKGFNAFQSILNCLRPAVVALIGGAGLSILSLVMFGQNTLNWASLNVIETGLFIVALFILRKCKCNPILVMSACGISGLLLNVALK